MGQVDNPLADWALTTSDVPESGFARERTVPADRLGALARALEMDSLSSVKVAYRVQPIAGGGYRLWGNVSAKGSQLCVVTLEPVPEAIEETFDVEFYREMAPPAGGEDQSILDERDVEPLEGEAIPVGRIVYETISAALDPYPRKEGAVFDWSDSKADSQDRTSPFAALAKLKNKP